ncbi:MAG: hypothetical protein JKY37_21665 [Nannocystaceae bacterium]|nr:hypothetical protein [Nannocystaceae bacterium]
MAQPVSDNAVFDAVWSIVTRRVAERTSATVDLLGDVLHGLGPVQRREHVLLAGEHVLNNDRQVLPRIARATGLGVCIYLGNRRIASASVLDAGAAPETDGYADALIAETVLRQHETFRGEIEREGRLHVIACRPLFAADKPEDYGPVGMVEAFLDQQAFRDIVTATLRQAEGADADGDGEKNLARMQTVMQFIDDVARRLQLLALNGNIIAAQAGDHGRAFRVVCRELSNLADQSKEAVSEVRKLTDAFTGNNGSADGEDDNAAADVQDTDPQAEPEPTREA